MKILFVSPTVPWPPDSGGRIRTGKLLKYLRPLCDVHLRAVLATEADEQAVANLAPLCASVQVFPRSRPDAVMRWTRSKLERWFHSPALEAALVRELAREHYDLVHLDEMFLARALPDPCDVPAVLHHHKLDLDLSELLPAAAGLAGSFDLHKLRRLEDEAARRYHHHILCSEEDARTFAARHPGLECAVVESGFDPDYFHRASPAPARERETLLFLGTLSYGPNVDALRYLLDDILPTLRAARAGILIDVVGSDPSPEVRALAAPGINIVGSVSDVRPHLERAAVLIAPLRIGGGTRVKLVEALGLATPVVTTTIGAEGLRLVDREHLRLADTPAAFARAVLEVLDDPAGARAMGERGLAFARERYTWDRLAARLLEHWQHAAASSP